MIAAYRRARCRRFSTRASHAAALAGIALAAAMLAGRPACGAAGIDPSLAPTPAPLGLRFGMQPREVPLPVLVAPKPRSQPKSDRPAIGPVTAPLPARAAAVSEQRSAPPASPGPTSLFASPRAPQTAASVPPRKRETGTGTTTAATSVAVAGDAPSPWSRAYIAACETAFDGISALAAVSPDWLAWRAQHLGAGGGTDFGDVIADRARAATYSASPRTREILDEQRSAGLYRLDGSLGRRVVCLLFTAQGLAQVFIAGEALSGIRDPIIARLEERNDLASLTVTREAERFSLSLLRPGCGFYCRLFGERLLVQRQLWLDQPTRVLVATKRAVLVSGLAGLFAGGGLDRELSDGLPDSFVVSIDLTRRARVLREALEPASAVDAVFAVSRTALTRAMTFTPYTLSRRAIVQSFLP